MSQNLCPNILMWSGKVGYKAKHLKKTVLHSMPSQKKRQSARFLPCFLLPSSKNPFFSAEKFPLEKDVSRREGREERRLPCWPINQSVINAVVTIPVSWISITHLNGSELLERTKRQVFSKKLKKILGLFSDLPWHLPSLPTTTGCSQDWVWVMRVDFDSYMCYACDAKNMHTRAHPVSRSSLRENGTFPPFSSSFA